MSSKEKIIQLIKDKGFKNVSKFCSKVGLSHGNLLHNFDGRYSMSVDRMFDVADALAVPVTEILEIMYPAHYSRNERIAQEGLFYRSDTPGIMYNIKDVERTMRDEGVSYNDSGFSRI